MVHQEKQPKRWEVIGEYTPSPLAKLFRKKDVWPAFFDDSLLFEIGNSRLTAYDVSDPTLPRQTGFFNTVSGGVAGVTPKHLVLLEGPLCTILDRPR